MSMQTFMYFYFHCAMFSTTTVSLTASNMGTYGFFYLNHGAVRT